MGGKGLEAETIQEEVQKFKSQAWWSALAELRVQGEKCGQGRPPWLWPAQLFLFTEIETDRETSFFGHKGVERPRRMYKIELGR